MLKLITVNKISVVQGDLEPWGFSRECDAALAKLGAFWELQSSDCEYFWFVCEKDVTQREENLWKMLFMIYDSWHKKGQHSLRTECSKGKWARGCEQEEWMKTWPERKGA